VSSIRILIVGRTGQVAYELQRARWPDGLEPEFAGREVLDLAKPGEAEALVLARRPLIVVNAAAYTAVDAAERERDQAFAVNRDGPAALAQGCADVGSSLIHLSTDYVFDGAKAGPYEEGDPIHPLSAYGESKAEGEAAIRTRLDRHIIIRTAWVYCPIGRNFVRTMLRLGAERDQLSVVDDQRGSPTSAAEVARAVVALAAALAGGRADAFGTYHFCGAGATTWYGFARAIFAGAERRGMRVPSTVTPITTAQYPTPAKRPMNSVLSSEQIARAYGVVARPWQDALDDCLDEIAAAR
jgi:dTDP-4-dehydrorhamnose reductase